MSQRLSSMLDPRGLQVLKKKLIAGQISPQVFKEVLKRQMVKLALQHRTRPAGGRPSLWTFLDRGLSPLRRRRPHVFNPGPMDMEELFT
ncbi:MAG: hypothetical protein ACE5ER_11115, partial [Nitrospinaceae bacterium]